MSKKLDVTQITNELSEGSAFFLSAVKPEARELPSPVPTKSKQASAKPLPDHEEQKITPSAQTRPLIRRTFDLFEDQLEYLNRKSLENRLAGKEGSMNAMVREALDDWINSRETSK